MSNSTVVDRELLFYSVLKLLGTLLSLSVLVEFTDADQTLADFIYRHEGNQWYLKDAWVTTTLIHKAGKYFSITLVLVVLVALAFSYFSPRLSAWKHRCRYLLIATVSSTLVISVGKSISHISCPWDFSRYGGTMEYIPLMEQLWVRNGSQCFPAGHASAGFAWVSLYFVGLHIHASWRWFALAFALLMGCVFGISQQLRGAHFLSHDLWSFGICWIVSFTFYEVMLKPYGSTR